MHKVGCFFLNMFKVSIKYPTKQIGRQEKQIHSTKFRCRELELKGTCISGSYSVYSINLCSIPRKHFFKLEEILLFLSLFNVFLSLKESGQQFWRCKGWRRETGIEGGHVFRASLGNQSSKWAGRSVLTQSLIIYFKAQLYVEVL